MNAIKVFLLLSFIMVEPIATIAQSKTTQQTGLLESKRQNNLQLINFKNYKVRRFSQNPLITLSEFDSTQLAQELSEHYLKKQPVSNFPNNLTLTQAQKIQNKFIKLILPYEGNLVGYKAGLTNQKAQERFKVSHPVLGSLLKKMLLKSGSTVSANFGAIPMLEGDLIVRVKNEGINTAKTPQEALKYLDAVIPFIELPDLVYAKKLELKGEMLVAINVGARLGIIGTPIPLQATNEWQKKLNNIQVTIVNEVGQKIAQGDSKALLGDPLKVVLWIRDQLQFQGKTLKQGDLLSLGSMTPAIPVQAGKTIYAKYKGLGSTNPINISVNFAK